MKVYVIKNKAGKYWMGYNAFGGKNGFSDKLTDVVFTSCYPTVCIDKIETFSIDNANVVECTLCEGDLEKELAVYKKALYKYVYDLYKWETCVGDELDETDLNNIQEEIDNVLDQARKELEDNNA